MLKLTPVFEASSEKLFTAWTEAEWIRLWLFKDDNSEIISADVDLTVPGRFSVKEKVNDGTIIDHFGHYRLIDRPHVLAFSLEVPKHFSGVSQVEIEFRTVEAGTKLILSSKASIRNWSRAAGDGCLRNLPGHSCKAR